MRVTAFVIDFVFVLCPCQALQCSQCDKTLNGRRALKLHVDSVHAAKLECQFCKKKMAKRLLKRHLTRKHKDEMSANEKGNFFISRVLS